MHNKKLLLCEKSIKIRTDTNDRFDMCSEKVDIFALLSCILICFGMMAETERNFTRKISFMWIKQ